jgi:hypothetical protein
MESLWHSSQDGPLNIFPTHKFKVPVNKANAIAAGSG